MFLHLVLRNPIEGLGMVSFPLFSHHYFNFHAAGALAISHHLTHPSVYSLVHILFIT